MAEPTVTIELTPSKVNAFRFNEMDLLMKVSSTDEKLYWAESTLEVPPPLSLAPNKQLERGKTLLGILNKGVEREKKLKVFAGNDVYPDIYPIKATVYLYDEEGVIAERKDIVKEVECIANDDKILEDQ